MCVAGVSEWLLPWRLVNQATVGSGTMLRSSDCQWLAAKASLWLPWVWLLGWPAAVALFPLFVVDTVQWVETLLGPALAVLRQAALPHPSVRLLWRVCPFSADCCHSLVSVLRHSAACPFALDSSASFGRFQLGVVSVVFYSWPVGGVLELLLVPRLLSRWKGLRFCLNDHFCHRGLQSCPLEALATQALRQFVPIYVQRDPGRQCGPRGARVGCQAQLGGHLPHHRGCERLPEEGYFLSFRLSDGTVLSKVPG